MESHVPRTYEQAVQQLLENLGEADKAELRGLTREELPDTHFGLGLWVRNHWLHGQNNQELMRSCAWQAGRAGGDWYWLDPDGASSTIVEGAWKALNGLEPGDDNA